MLTGGWSGVASPWVYSGGNIALAEVLLRALPLKEGTVWGVRWAPFLFPGVRVLIILTMEWAGFL